MNMNEKRKGILNKKFTFFFLAVVLFWLKTYVVYRLEFQLGIDNGMQQFLLLINPISSALFFLGIGLFFKGKARLWVTIIIEFVMSLFLYANVVYYRFFNDFLTLPVILHPNNASELSGSALALMKGADIFYFTDTIILIALVVFRAIHPQRNIQKRWIAAVMASAVLIFSANLALAEADRPQLLTRAFDRNYLVKYLGAYNYSIYDAIKTTKSTAQRALADSSDLSEVQNFTRSHYTPPNPKYFGKEKGMNVIYVSLESLQNFIIDYKLDGQEVTPFLNSLAHDKHTFYFDNFFHQVGQGKTSDAEFMMANSLFPLNQGSVFMQKARNTYQAQPAILANHGYTTATFHGNYKTFWNRDEMYKSLGIQKFFDANYYDMSDQNTINYGMKDKPFIEESMPYLQSLKQPFDAKFILLSNHFPFALDEEDIDFSAAHTNDNVVNRYFQTAHYMDEAVEQFFDELKRAGLYDNTIIVMYGDHYGISTNHNKAMKQIMGEEITPYVNAQMQRVPLFIHVPHVKGKVVHQYGGEVDVRSTVLHLLGIDTKKFVGFGSDLLSPEHREIVPFRNGDFVTPDYTYVSGKCYSNPNGVPVENKVCGPYKEIARKELQFSDKVVYGDLLRFYTPKGFKPIDRKSISYTKDETKNELNTSNE